MLALRSIAISQFKSFHHKSFVFQKDFQLRYVIFILSVVLFAIILAAGPTYFFLNQNYQTFINLAYDYSPDLLEHLERERTFINSFLAIMFVGILTFCFYFGLRLTARIIEPLNILETHLKRMTRGELYLPNIHIKKNDEFNDLVDSYNYFYNSLRSQTRNDLRRLNSLNIDSNNRDAHQFWTEMVTEKSRQLGEITPNVNNMVNELF